jgi:cellulose synthase/poly-beta-1,6-N-acetylglucosamine synthase-like glycosyltransferase
MERREHEPIGLNSEPLENDFPFDLRWEESLDGFDHRIAGNDDPALVDPFGEEVVPVQACGGEAAICEVVSDHPVVFLGHPSVEASEPCLDVNEGDFGGVGGQRTGGDRVGVALNDDGERAVLCEEIIEALGGATDLCAAAFCSDPDVNVGAGHAELVEEDLGQLRVVVLARVDHTSGRSEEPNETREFDDLGARTENNGNGTAREIGHTESCLLRVHGTLRVVMLRLLASIPQVIIAALAGYNATVALRGWRNRTPAPAAGARTMRVVIPAHNEATVIGNVVADLQAQDYQSDMTDVIVIADRCTDSTVTAAEPARIVERDEGVEGKGAAIAWYLDSEPLARAEILVVVDADNRVPPNFLQRIADEVTAGHDVVQCYLDVTNPDESPMTLASALSYWAGNRMVQLARSNLGWSADLGGTGMAFTGEALVEVGGFGDGLTEDQELGVWFALAGRKVEWLHDVRIYDEKPAGAAPAVRQRARWMAGRRAVARRYLGSLWRGAVEERSLRLFDVGLRLIQPGRSFIAALSGALTVISWATRSRLLFPWPVWGAITAVQFFEPIPFLARDGVAPRYLLRYPFLAILGILWIPIRIASAIATGWGHTTHTGSTEKAAD